MLQSGGASAFSPRGLGETRSMNLARSPSGSSGAGASAAGASSLVGSRMLLLYAAAAFAVGYVGSLWIQRGGSTASGHHPSGEAAHQQRLQGGGNEAALPPAQEGNTSAPSLPLMYVYPLPPDVYLGGIASTSVYREKDMKIMWRECYSMEWVLPQAWQRLGLITTDPSQASLFLVPHAADAHFHECLGYGNDKPCRPATQRYFASLVHHVIHAYPQWNRTGGADHVFIFSHDGGLALFDTAADEEWPWAEGPRPGLIRSIREVIGRATFMQPLGSRRHGYYSSALDVPIMPYGSLPKGAQPPAEGEDPDAVPFPSTLAYFSGGLHGRSRRNISLAVANNPDVQFFARYDPEYGAHLSRAHARFCMHLPGFADIVWSGRIAHIVSAGCVPVIIIDDLDLPLERLLEWRSFALFVSEADASTPGRLAEIIRAVPEARWRAMRRRLLQVRRMLMYEPPATDSPFPLQTPPLPPAPVVRDAAYWAYVDLVARRAMWSAVTQVAPAADAEGSLLSPVVQTRDLQAFRPPFRWW